MPHDKAQHVAGRSADGETYGHFVSAKRHEIREQAVQTDCRKGYSRHAEDAEEPRTEAAGGCPAVDQRVERRYSCERLILIQLTNDRTKSRRNCSRFSSGANEDGHRPRVLRVRLVGLGAHTLIDAGPSRVRHNPYNRHPPIIPERETLPERVLVGPVRFRRGLVDDGDALPASSVAIRERASTEHCNLQDLEEVRRDDVKGERLLNPLRPTLDRERGRARPTHDRTPRGSTSDTR